jgi:hypothetical protein
LVLGFRRGNLVPGLPQAQKIRQVENDLAQVQAIVIGLERGGAIFVSSRNRGPLDTVRRAPVELRQQQCACEGFVLANCIARVVGGLQLRVVLQSQLVHFQQVRRASGDGQANYERQE